MTIHELGCGCEAVADPEGRLALVSRCGRHAPEHRSGVYVCGECGFTSTFFDRLERHVYAVHLGAEVA